MFRSFGPGLGEICFPLAKLNSRIQILEILFTTEKIGKNRGTTPKKTGQKTHKNRRQNRSNLLSGTLYIYIYIYITNKQTKKKTFFYY